MSLMPFALFLFIAGAFLAGVIYYNTEGDYPFFYWLTWAMMGGGLLTAIASVRPVRTDYVLWTSVLSLILLLTFLVGRIDEEFLPSAWVGAAALGTNVLLVVLGLLLPSSQMAGVLFIISLVALGAGFALRAGDYFFYDAAYTAAGVLAITSVLLASKSVRSPIEDLNQVQIPRLNANIETSLERVAAYDKALGQANSYRGEIEQEFSADDKSFLGMADQSIEAADKHFTLANEALAGLDPEPPASAYSAEVAARISQKNEQAALAAAESQAAIDQLGGVQQLFESLSEEWIKEYLWFEVDGYWKSEDDDYASHNVCYYGERVSKRKGDNIQEQIISDAADREGNPNAFSGDVNGRDWKFFTVADYNEMVNSGVIPASSSSIDDDEEAGEYLCGRSPQTGTYGALGEPTVIIEKEYGSLTREVGDEGASFVGDERYGSWCQQQPDGTIKALPADQTPPADAQWCWYQKPHDSNHYYWERRHSGGSFIWIRGHRRCVYCTPSTWGGGDLIPDRTLAKSLGTEGSSVRGPADQGGGPGTGK